jgi:hypothetical protein
MEQPCDDSVSSIAARHDSPPSKFAPTDRQGRRLPPQADLLEAIGRRTAQLDRHGMGTPPEIENRPSITGTFSGIEDRSLIPESFGGAFVARPGHAFRLARRVPEIFLRSSDVFD